MPKNSPDRVVCVCAALLIALATTNNSASQIAPERASITVSSRPGDAVEIAATNTNGVAHFSDLPPGQLRIIAAAEGFAPARHAIAATARVAAKTIRLTPAQ